MKEGLQRESGKESSKESSKESNRAGNRAKSWLRIEQGNELEIGQGLRVQIQKKLNKGKSISSKLRTSVKSRRLIWEIIRENDERLKILLEGQVSFKTKTPTDGFTERLEQRVVETREIRNGGMVI